MPDRFLPLARGRGNTTPKTRGLSATFVTGQSLREAHCAQRLRPASPTTEQSIQRAPRLMISLILFGSIMLKLAFIWYLDGRAYYDVSKAVNFGYLVHQKTFSIHTDIINSKTSLDPILWFYLLFY
jgi:hypothetical protein